MRKILLILFTVLFAHACAQQGSGSVEKGFKYKPGSLTGSKFSETASSYDITFSGSHTGNFAALTTQTINGASYVGIAVSDSPAAISYLAPAETFSMKIYFRADSLESGVTIGPMVPDDGIIDDDEGKECRITINDGSLHAFDGGTVSFTCTNNDDGTWNIVMGGSPTFGGTPLSITTLKARKL